MQRLHSSTIPRILQLLVLLLIGKVIVATWISYRDYMPPDFESVFLDGREGDFWQGYHRAFYVHIISGPISLLLGMLLVSQQFRQHWPKWHRSLGRMQVACVLLVVTPSGLWMAKSAAFGPVAGAGFAALALATGLTVALGWRAAVQRRFEVHRRWMLRCFVLLCSAVVIRINGGMGSVLGIEAEWYYVQSAWTSWIVPWFALEVLEIVRSRRAVRL